MRFHVIENPSAGRGGGRAFLDAVQRILREGGNDVTAFVGSSAAAVVDHVRALDRGAADRLLLAGGDGTLNAVLNARHALPWPVGVIPMGTANLVARDAGFDPGAGPEETAAALAGAEPWVVDVLSVEHAGGPAPRLAVACVSAGLDAEIVEAVEQARDAGSRSGGYARWVAPGLRTLSAHRFEPMEVVVDGGVVQNAPFVVVQNALSYGGLFQISPEARLDSGRLDVATLFPRTHRDMVRLAVAAAARRIHRDRAVRVLEGRSVTIRSPRARPVQADGDPSGTTDVRVTLLPRRLTLLRVPVAPGAGGPAPVSPQTPPGSA